MSTNSRPDDGARVRASGITKLICKFRRHTTIRLELIDLNKFLQRLPHEQREVVLLIGLEQLSYDEAAKVLGVPIGTVMSRLSRGREQLRSMMNRGSSAAQLKVIK